MPALPRAFVTSAKPLPDDFRNVDGPVPAPDDGELLLRNLYLPLDPSMRGRMNDSHGSYAPPYALDAPPGRRDGGAP